MWSPTKEDRDVLIKALQTMICFTETGTSDLRAGDVASGKGGGAVAVKELTAEQVKLVKHSEQLIQALKKHAEASQPKGGKLSTSEYAELCRLQSEHRVASVADRSNLMAPDKISRLLELKARFEAFGRAIPSTRD